MNNIEYLRRLLDESASSLAEHFDSVRIICTKHDAEDIGSSETGFFTCGRGNFQAQVGSVIEWFDAMREETRCAVRDTLNDEDE